MNNQKTLRGTELPMLINFSYPSDPSITLDSIEWYTEWFCTTYNQRKAVKLTKNDCYRHSEIIDGREVVSWYALVDTTTLSPGVLMMRFMAYIPNEDASDGVREEYVEVQTMERLV